MIVEDLGAIVTRFKSAEEKEKSKMNAAAITPVDKANDNHIKFVGQSLLELIEYDVNSTSSLDDQESQSPCSLDYSCFSASDCGNNINEQSSLSGVIERCAISPLGEEEENLLRNCEAKVRSSSCGDNKNESSGQVTLVVPWLLEASDRKKLYGTATSKINYAESIGMMENIDQSMFSNQEEQEAYIRTWLVEDAGMPEEASELNIM